MLPSCRGQVEIAQRLDACKQRCVRHNLTSDAIRKNRSTFRVDGGGADDASAFSSSAHAHSREPSDAETRLKAEIVHLQERLLTAMEEMEDQEVEMVELMREKDRAPDALVFFATMHDPAYAQNLNQLVLQLKQLKPFVEGSGHVDFITLRKRMQVCIALTPSIERLCDRYAHMYKKWSNYRLNWFADRRMTGGTADSFNSCPLCFQSIGAAGAAAAAAGQNASSTSSPKKLTKQALSRAEKKKQERDLMKRHEELQKELLKKSHYTSSEHQMPQLNASVQSKGLAEASSTSSSRQRHQINLPSIS